MDVFVEQIVKKKWSNVEYLKVWGIIFGVAILFVVLNLIAVMVFGLMILFTIAIPFVVAAIFAAWYLISSLRIEYEYSVTNGYMVIDCITSRRKRKRMIAFEARDVEELKLFNEAEYMEKQFDKILPLWDAEPEQLPWCLEVTHRDYGRTLVLFSPNERVLAALKPFLRRSVAIRAFEKKQ